MSTTSVLKAGLFEELRAHVARASHDLLENHRKARRLQRQYRQILGELQVLSDRELLDLGFSRYNIREIAYDHVYGNK
jgi:uncharacterized protein YjiS (DUF1127 family)